ncbi:MAG: hypothetical protein QOG50_3616 [Actinomycetota bacterium]|nr:hypothetical protein [Actinomycetota bacterium]
MKDRSTDSGLDPAEQRSRTSGGASGNARLTGSIGALIFVVLAAEGLTLLGVRQLLSTHVFIGMLLVPAVAVKTASTLYRFQRYYAGKPDYVIKGPPPIILRLLGPAVVVTTIGMLATGIAALAEGPSSRWLVQAHKLSFLIWFAVMTVHVLGHILETPALAFADWRRAESSQVPAARTRIIVLIVTVAVGLVLATASLGWIGPWHHAPH